MKLSVIIPAYNAENYILRALNSAVNQSLQDKEIIVIVDGSKDNTLNLVQEFCKTNKNVKYQYIENSGLSVARNTGVDIAKGEYIAFLDSDDFFAEDTILEKYYNLCVENDLDIIRGAYKIFDEDKDDFVPHYTPNFPYLNKILYGTEFLNYSMQYHFNEVVAWLGLYKREYLQKNNLKFIKGIYYEDHPYLLKILLDKNAKTMQTNDYFYVYVKRKGTITTNLTYKHAQDIATVISEEFSLLKNARVDKKTYKSALKYISSSFYQLTSIYGRVDKSLRKKCVKFVPFSLRVKLTFYPYNSYHFKKIFLFNFCRIILDFYYNRNV